MVGECDECGNVETNTLWDNNNISVSFRRTGNMNDIFLPLKQSSVSKREQLIKVPVCFVLK